MVRARPARGFVDPRVVSPGPRRPSVPLAGSYTNSHDTSTPYIPPPWSLPERARRVSEAPFSGSWDPNPLCRSPQSRAAPISCQCHGNACVARDVQAVCRLSVLPRHTPSPAHPRHARGGHVRADTQKPGTLIPRLCPSRARARPLLKAAMRLHDRELGRRFSLSWHLWHLWRVVERRHNVVVRSRKNEICFYYSLLSDEEKDKRKTRVRPHDRVHPGPWSITRNLKVSCPLGYPPQAWSRRRQEVAARFASSAGGESGGRPSRRSTDGGSNRWV